MVMESRFDQERRWLAELDQLGPTAVRALLRNRKPVMSQPPSPEVAFIEAWLRRHDRRVRLRRLRLLLPILAVLAVVLAAVLLVMTR